MAAGALTGSTNASSIGQSGRGIAMTAAGKADI
jgi:hypothetical protein